MKPIKALLLWAFASLALAMSVSAQSTLPPISPSVEVLVDTDCEFSGLWSSGSAPYPESFINPFGLIGGIELVSSGGPVALNEIGLAVFDNMGLGGNVRFFPPFGLEPTVYEFPAAEYTYHVTQSFDQSNGMWSGTFAVHSTACGVPETGSSLWLLGGGIGFAFAGRRWSKKR
jgi:hypothetical protein